MKKIIIVSACIFWSSILVAQMLVRYDEWYKFVSVNKNEKVFITEQDVYNVYSGITGYKLNGEQLVESNFESMPVNKDTNVTYTPVYLFGNYIKLKNNNQRTTILDKDSIVYDVNNRIFKVYRPVLGSKTSTAIYKLKYINDTTVLETIYEPLNKFSEAILYSIDKDHNLKAVKEAFVESKKIYTDDIKIDSIKWDKTTRFYYNKTMTRIDSIKITSILNGNRKVVSTQVFTYKNNRPISSYVRDESKKKIIYRQSYKYI